MEIKSSKNDPRMEIKPSYDGKKNHSMMKMKSSKDGKSNLMKEIK